MYYSNIMERRSASVTYVKKITTYVLYYRKPKLEPIYEL